MELKNITTNGLRITPSKYNKGSLYFTGGLVTVGAYLTGDISQAYNNANLNTSPFCIEMWVYPKSLGNCEFPGLFDNRTSGPDTTGVAIYWDVDPTIPTDLKSFVSGSIPMNAGIPLDKWTHIALTRSGLTYNTFVDGQLKNTTTDTATVNSLRNNFRIGSTFDNYVFNGYITNLRLVQNSVVYSGGFTPSKVPLGIHTSGNTLLLVKAETNDTRFTDSSNYGITLTENNGTVTWSSFSPFGHHV